MNFSRTWYVGTLHFLNAGVLIPLVISLVAGAILSLFVAQNSFVMQVLSLVIWNIGIWLGVKYSAKLINRTFTGFADRQVALEGLIYNALIAAGLLIYGLYIANTIEGATFSYIGSFIFIISATVSTILYYYFSLRYLEGRE